MLTCIGGYAYQILSLHISMYKIEKLKFYCSLLGRVVEGCVHVMAIIENEFWRELIKTFSGEKVLWEIKNEHYKVKFLIFD